MTITTSGLTLVVPTWVLWIIAAYLVLSCLEKVLEVRVRQLELQKVKRGYV